MKFKETKILVLLLCFSGAINAQVFLKSSEVIEMDSRFDSLVDPKMRMVLQGYETIMKKEIDRVIGSCQKYMESRAPESLLSNFLSDQLLAKANKISSEPVDLSVINLGGIRAPLNKGDVTVSDLYRIMPFENELVIVRLKGNDVRAVFENIASEGGEGVSNVRLEIKDHKINSLSVGGVPLDDEKYYRVATMDYLAEGNSGMTAFLKATERINTGIRVRDLYIEQIEKLTSEGKAIDAILDGRIKIIK